MPHAAHPPKTVTEASPTAIALSEVERRVLKAIDMEAAVAFLRELISIPTLSGRETEGQDRVAAEMRAIGQDVDRWEFSIDSLRSHPSFSMEVDRTRGVGVVGRMGAGRGRTLLLNGHIDVVPPGNEGAWTDPPWTAAVRDGRVYGRGAVDMKGGLACALAAGRAIRESGVTLRGTLLVESVIGEEDGGVGTLAASLRGYRGEGAVVLEPTELKIAPAQAGALSFRVTVRGRAAHASVREEGVSAIEKFVALFEAIRSLERERNRTLRDPLFARYEIPYAIGIGRVRGGTWPSSVAEDLTFEGRYGIAPGEDLEMARAAFEDAISRAAHEDSWLRDHPPHVEWWGGQFEPASISAGEPIVATTAGALEGVTGEKAVLEGMPYGSDMRHLVHVARTPTILFGPGDVRRAHGPDEFVPIEDLTTAARTIALTCLRFCGVA